MENQFKKSHFFNVLVVGDNPEEILAKYDKRNLVEKYIKYKYKDAEKLKKTALKCLDELLNNITKVGLDSFAEEALKNRRDRLNTMSNFEYYRDLTSGLYYDENGNALSEENPNGKFDDFKVGKNYANPFITLDGKEVYSCKVGDIDWRKMHLNLEKQEQYQLAWKLCVDKVQPQTEKEMRISEAMAHMDNYFERFKDCEAYVLYNTSFWAYAYTNGTIWQSMDGKNPSEWITDFYNDFIANLDFNTKISIYECNLKY